MKDDLKLLDNMEAQDISFINSHMYLKVRDDDNEECEFWENYEKKCREAGGWVDQEKEKEGEEQEGTEECCGCTAQSRNLILAGVAIMLAANLIMMLEFVANNVEYESQYGSLVGLRSQSFSEAFSTYIAGVHTAAKDQQHHSAMSFTTVMRIVFSILCLLRMGYLLNLLLLVATVKRNAIYIFPFLPQYHITITVMNLMLMILEAVMLFIGHNGFKVLTFIEASIGVLNLLICVYSLILVYYQYNNGWKCGRTVDGDEQGTFQEGGEPMEIADNNQGPISLYLDEKLLDYAII